MEWINKIKTGVAQYFDTLIKERADWVEPNLNNIKSGVLRTIDETSADVVVHGEWKKGIPYICSVCGKPAPDEKNTGEKYSCWTSPYCPHCGAKMEERSDT